MSRFSRGMNVLALIPLLMGFAMTQAKPYPQAQIASAHGEKARDFTLKDQDGKDFKLSSHRGSWVLLYFYRGYW